ncbi:MAG: GNAT family N-acetyltransferase [Geodermatophilaceae bacterium]|nr:GNAT family N-acetyltransferase [Geodermatophilaceae bacterium]
MIEFSQQLCARALAALSELESRTVAADGGRLKLEWGALENRPGTEVDDLLWWDGDRLLGFLGLYAFGGPTIEIAGMVDPLSRRRGIGSALLDSALPLCRDRGPDRALLVTPRASVGGREFARGRGGVLDHSEHALVLHGAPDGAPHDDAPDHVPSDPRITLRRGTREDAVDVARLHTAAFGWSSATGEGPLSSGSAYTVMVEHGGVVVGTLRVTVEHGVGGVYGFAVDPRWQGRGIGRDVLRRVCRRLFADGVDRVALEVAVDNEHALGLYTSVGFTPLTTEDYYALPR